jgi:hypothetical protein
VVYPSSALKRYAFHYLIYGHVWDAFVNDQYANESTLGIDDNIEISAPLLLLWSNEDRVVNGDTLSPGGPGLGTHTWSEQGETMTRWVRVVNRPVDTNDAVAMNGPIRTAANGTNNPMSSWFEVESWNESLPEVGWGGAEARLTVYDPAIYDGIFTTGRSVSIFVEEYEDGSLISARESFSGFVIDTENDDVQAGHSYTFRCGSVMTLYQLPGRDGGASIFLDEAYHNSRAVIDNGTGTYVVPQTTLLASIYKHIIFNLTPGKVIAHLMLWHMWVRVNGTTYRLMQVVDWRRDYWNDPPDEDMYIPAVGIREGNIGQQIAGLIPPEVYRAYCDYRSGIVVTIDHEFKPTPDASLDTIDMDTVYAVRNLGGLDDTVGQVWLPQASITQLVMNQPVKIFKYHATADANRSTYQPPVPFLVATDAGGETIGHGLYDKKNSQQRKAVHLPGAKWSLHNKMTLEGNEWMVESVVHAVNNNQITGHEQVCTVRRIDIS